MAKKKRVYDSMTAKQRRQYWRDQYQNSRERRLAYAAQPHRRRAHRDYMRNQRAAAAAPKLRMCECGRTWGACIPCGGTEPV